MSQDQELQKAKEILLAGDVVAVPTETVYGLAASIFSETGLQRIFAVKERPFFDPLIVHIADLEQKGQVIREWPHAAEVLAEKFWPGPLTMVLPKQAQLNPLITAGLETVGLRMPNHPVIRELIRAVGTPLAAPSANKFGKTSPTKAEHVRKAFPNILVLDGGPSEVGVESTVVEFTGSGSEMLVSILRPGAVTASMIATAFKDAGLSCLVETRNSAAAPGHTPHHYMPDIPLVILEHAKLDRDILKQIGADLEIPADGKSAEIVLESDPRLAARSLYIRLREGAESGASFLYVVKKKPQSGGLWDAIWDRLRRAASKTY